MGWEAWFILAIIALIFVGLTRDLLPPDALLVGGVVVVAIVGRAAAAWNPERAEYWITPAEAFNGFSNLSMLTVAALFVVAAALRETGALDILGGRLLGKARTERAAIVRMGVQVSAVSAFLNNTPVVAMFLPFISDWCRKHRISPSRLLMPLSFFAILGGLCTLVGTSTNLVTNGLMVERSMAASDPLIRDGLRSMTLFELAKVGLPMAIVGTLYLLTLGKRLLPDRKDLIEQLGESSREYLVNMTVEPGCRLVGQAVEEAGLRHLPGLFLIEILRVDRVITPVAPDQVIRAGDRLTFTGVVSNIVDLERIPGLVPASDEGYEASTSRGGARRLCEAVISHTSPLIGISIRDANFRAMYNAVVVAVHRGGTRLKGRVGDIVLRGGDTLLLQTGPHFVRAHRNNPDFYLVTGVDEWRPIRHDRAPLAIGVLGLLIVMLAVTTATKAVPEVLVAFAAAGLMVGARCISVAAARQSIDWATLLTIAASFGLSRALEKSGAARVIAEMVVHLARICETPEARAVAALAIIYLVTVLLSELISNNAAAALLLPFGVNIAVAMNLSPRPFAMAIALAASACFASPIGYQTHLMVWGPGGYTFKDFIRVGLPLDILLWIVAVALIPIAWPFQP